MPKQYLAISGKPMLSHAMRALADVERIEKVFVVVSPEDHRIDDAVLRSGALPQRCEILRVGGATRQASVLNGLHAIREHAGDSDWILVHDAARPGLTPLLVERLIGSVGGEDCGGLLAVPVVDTIKQAEGSFAVATVPRETLWAAQTPQMFRYGVLIEALERATHVTDEASAIEQMGMNPRLVPGSARNFKVTLPTDVAVAELMLKGEE